MIEEKIEYFPIKTSAGQGELAVRIWPCREKKGRVLCFHEAACSGAEFIFLAEALNSAGFEVVAPDFIGHGRSTFFGQPDVYQWVEFVNCTARLVRRYTDDSTHLLGASFGGMALFIYMLAARNAPKSATFVDIPLYRAPAPGVRSRMMSLIRSEFDNLADAKAHFAACRHPLHPDALHLEPYLTEQRFHVVDGKFRIRCDPLAMDRYDADQRSLSGTKPGFNYLDELSSLRCNCLFLYGADSPNLNSEVFREVSERHPNLSFDIIEGKHPPPLMSFAQIRPIVDFVERQASAVATT